MATVPDPAYERPLDEPLSEEFDESKVELEDIVDATDAGREIASAIDYAEVRTLLGLGTAAQQASSAFAPAVHTHTSAAITDLTEAVQDIVGAFFGAGTGASVTYNDAANTITVSATGTSDLEAIRDAIGVALVGVGNISVTVNDVSDTITISTTATVNATDAALRDRSTHTNTQSADTIVDGTANKVYTAAEKTKLAGIASGASANSSDATLLSRSNHTGSQAASTISDFSEAVDDRIAALLVAGTGITFTYNDAANTFTIDGTAGALDAEGVRDTIAAALVAGTNVSIVVNDAGDTITLNAAMDAEFIRDTIGAALTAGAGISITVNDAGDTISIAGLTLGTGTPQMDGVGAAGNATTAAPFNHVHPTDTTRAPLASPTFTGTPAAPTPAQDTNTTQLATTAFMIAQASAVNPLMNGSAAIGTSLRYSRQDHVHPSDTSRLAAAAVSAFGLTLVDDVDAATARATLALGTAAVVNTGTGASNAILGNDSRLTDARTPTAHTHPVADLSDASANGRSLVSAADYAAMRSLLSLGTAALANIGTGISNVILGNDSRLTDARTPTAHTHAVADLSDATANGRSLISAANYAAMRTLLSLGGAALLNVGTSTGTVAAGDDARLSDARTPTTHTHTVSQLSDATANGRSLIAAADYAAMRTLLSLGGAALLSVGTTTGTVAAGDDSRLSNARTPTAHTHPVADISDASANGRSLISAANYAAMRTLLGLGGAALLNVGTSSSTVAAGDDSRITTAAPRPTTSAGVGNFVQISSSVGGALVLPAGGTWAWFAYGINNTTGAVVAGGANVTAGGTTLIGATSPYAWFGFAWRVT